MTRAITGRIPVRIAADDDFEIQSQREVKRALTSRRLVHPASADNFGIWSQR